MRISYQNDPIYATENARQWHYNAIFNEEPIMNDQAAPNDLRSHPGTDAGDVDALRTAFERDGFVIARGVFPAGDLDALKNEITAEIDGRARKLQAKGELDALHANLPFTQRFAAIHHACPSIQAGFDVSGRHGMYGREMFSLMHHPRLLDAVEALIGGEISANPIQHIRAKPPALPGEEGAGFFNVPWHQDSGVTMEDSDVSPILTCWIPIGDATEEMGCMRVIPGVHRQGHLPHIKSPYGTTIDPAHFPATDPVLAECREGDVVIMSQFTPHHSTPNRSDICRWSYDMRFHVTGQPAGRDWLPAFPVRSRSGEYEPMSDRDEWQRLWEAALNSPDNRGIVHRVVEPAT